MYLHPVFIKKMPANIEGRDFVIGDLHGCYDELVSLLKHVKFNPKIDRLFSTGDLIDRGPKPVECFELLSKPWFYPVLGNHEDVLLNKIKLLKSGEDYSFNDEELEYIQILEPYLNHILQLPLVYEIEHMLLDKYYIIHAEILPEHINNSISYEPKIYNQFLDMMSSEDLSTEIRSFFSSSYEDNSAIDYSLKQKLLWSRKIINRFYEDHKQEIINCNFNFLNNNIIEQSIKIFCGHNIVPFPIKIGQQYYLDTGAALGYFEQVNSFGMFTKFGHEFFGLTMVDVSTGLTYNCITTDNKDPNKKRGTIVRMEHPLYNIENN